jgi:hypothetical protein
MARQSSVMAFGDCVFKFCSKIINTVMIFIWKIILEDQRFATILKMLTFMCLLKISDSVQYFFRIF